MKARAMEAFAPGTLPWGARAAGAPAGRGVRVFVIERADMPRETHGAGERPGGAAGREGRRETAVGDGKALAAVIRYVAPAAEVLAVSVLGRGAAAPLAVLEGTLRHAVRSRARVVSLDLALAAGIDRARLRALFREALRAGAILVASAGDAPARWSRADLPEVIGAAADARLGARSLRYSRGGPLECRAAGHPFAPGAGRGERDLRAHGFAAGRVAGVVACILEARPRADLAAVRDELEAHFGRKNIVDPDR